MWWPTTPTNDLHRQFWRAVLDTVEGVGGEVEVQEVMRLWAAVTPTKSRRLVSCGIMHGLPAVVHPLFCMRLG